MAYIPKSFIYFLISIGTIENSSKHIAYKVARGAMLIKSDDEYYYSKKPILGN